MLIQKKKDPHKECQIRNRVKQVQWCSSVGLQLLQPARMHQQLSSLYGVCYVGTGVTFLLYKRLKSTCQGYIEVFLDTYRKSWSALPAMTEDVPRYPDQLFHCQQEGLTCTRSFQLHTFYTLKNGTATTLGATYSSCAFPPLPQPARSYMEAYQMRTPPAFIYAARSRSRRGPGENMRAALRQTLTTFEVVFPASMTNLTASVFLLNTSSSWRMILKDNFTDAETWTLIRRNRCGRMHFPRFFQC